MILTNKEEIQKARNLFMIEMGKSKKCLKKICNDEDISYTNVYNSLYRSKYFDLSFCNSILSKLGSSKKFNFKFELIEK